MVPNHQHLYRNLFEQCILNGIISATGASNCACRCFENPTEFLKSFPGTTWDILNEGRHHAEDPVQVQKSILLLTGTHMHVSWRSMLPKVFPIFGFAGGEL